MFIEILFNDGHIEALQVTDVHFKRKDIILSELNHRIITEDAEEDNIISLGGIKLIREIGGDTQFNAMNHVIRQKLASKLNDKFIPNEGSDHNTRQWDCGVGH